VVVDPIFGILGHREGEKEILPDGFFSPNLGSGFHLGVDPAQVPVSVDGEKRVVHPLEDIDDLLLGPLLLIDIGAGAVPFDDFSLGVPYRSSRA
jgi:hypothetical protein